MTLTTALSLLPAPFATLVAVIAVLGAVHRVFFLPAAESSLKLGHGLLALGRDVVKLLHDVIELLDAWRRYRRGD
jgi:hypothetical protein